MIDSVRSIRKFRRRKIRHIYPSDISPYRFSAAGLFPSLFFEVQERGIFVGDFVLNLRGQQINLRVEVTHTTAKSFERI